MIYQVILKDGKSIDDIDLWKLVPNLSIGDGFEVYNVTSGIVSLALLTGTDFIICSSVFVAPHVKEKDTPEKAYDRAMGVVR